MSPREEVKVEHKVSVAAFTSRDEKWVGKGRGGGHYRGKMGARKGA